MKVARTISRIEQPHRKHTEFLISGSQYAAYGKTTQMHPQSWWCRNLRGDHVKEGPLMKAYGAPPPLVSVAK